MTSRNSTQLQPFTLFKLFKSLAPLKDFSASFQQYVFRYNCTYYIFRVISFPINGRMGKGKLLVSSLAGTAYIWGMSVLAWPPRVGNSFHYWALMCDSNSHPHYSYSRSEFIRSLIGPLTCHTSSTLEYLPPHTRVEKMFTYICWHVTWSFWNLNFCHEIAKSFFLNSATYNPLSDLPGHCHKVSPCYFAWCTTTEGCLWLL